MAGHRHHRHRRTGQTALARRTARTRWTRGLIRSPKSGSLPGANLASRLAPICEHGRHMIVEYRKRMLSWTPFVVGGLCLVLFAGCAPRLRRDSAAPAASLITPAGLRWSEVFDESAFAPYSKSGNSSIEGQAFVRTRRGAVVTAAGLQVALIPATPYTKEIFDQQFMRPDVDPRLNEYRRVTTADASGHFTFDQIPAGQYYLSCTVYWEDAPSHSKPIRVTIFGSARTEPGQRTRVQLSRVYPYDD